MKKNLMTIFCITMLAVSGSSMHAEKLSEAWARLWEKNQHKWADYVPTEQQEKLNPENKEWHSKLDEQWKKYHDLEAVGMKRVPDPNAWAIVTNRCNEDIDKHYAQLAKYDEMKRSIIRNSLVQCVLNMIDKEEYYLKPRRKIDVEKDNYIRSIKFGGYGETVGSYGGKVNNDLYNDIYFNPLKEQANTLFRMETSMYEDELKCLSIHKNILVDLLNDESNRNKDGFLDNEYSNLRGQFQLVCSEEEKFQMSHDIFRENSDIIGVEITDNRKTFSKSLLKKNAFNHVQKYYSDFVKEDAVRDSNRS